MSGIAPHTGFAGVRFTILSDEGHINDWHRTLVVNKAKVPSSNSTIRQFDGFDDFAMETRLLFASRDDFQRFEALQGIPGAFVHLADISAYTRIQDTWYEHGDDYVTWPGATMQIMETPRRLRGGRVIARVRFERGEA